MESLEGAAVPGRVVGNGIPISCRNPETCSEHKEKGPHVGLCFFVSYVFGAFAVETLHRIAQTHKSCGAGGERSEVLTPHSHVFLPGDLPIGIAHRETCLPPF
jgi:hypothetical protein